jgi:hypothetical protein
MDELARMEMLEGDEMERKDRAASGNRWGGETVL